MTAYVVYNPLEGTWRASTESRHAYTRTLQRAATFDTRNQALEESLQTEVVLTFAEAKRHRQRMKARTYRLSARFVDERLTAGPFFSRRDLDRHISVLRREGATRFRIYTQHTEGETKNA